MSSDENVFSSKRISISVSTGPSEWIKQTVKNHHKNRGKGKSLKLLSLVTDDGPVDRDILLETKKLASNMTDADGIVHIRAAFC